ncbi:MAG: aminotransferase class I/II-fold pyridoxal phosphate-dependent enzyme [Candidatus Eisenbacteria bacterium]|nr:aminotransferase class I/II-fold pyridoxal phosphate-dependent enzyme [Candidatus Eisenbacteria bacterium]
MALRRTRNSLRDHRLGSSGLSRRSFFGATAGMAALALLRGPRIGATAPADLPVRDDYVGRLCYNENPLGPSPLAQAAMVDAVPMGHRYGDWYAESLREDLADLHQVERPQTIAGCGATEILRLAAFAFADPEGNVVVPTPSYGQFGSDCAFMGAEVRHSGLDQDWRIDLADMASQVDAHTTAVCLTNPNNPTATVLPAVDIAAFVDALPEHVTVIIDEAYHEYIHDPAYESAMELVRQGKNVVVIRTFSKIFGMAGVRLGYAVGKQSLIGSMTMWHNWGTVSRLALEGGRAALTDAQHISDTVALNDQAKQLCFDGFDALGLDYIPSETNFFMVDVGQPAGPVSAALADEGIYVRTGWGMQNHLRVSTGTLEEMQSFLTVLEQILTGSGAPDRHPPRFSILEGNYPNPFRSHTELSYRLARDADVRLQLYDAQGRAIRTLVRARRRAGLHALQWDGRDGRGAAVPAGIYYYRLTAGDFMQTRRMIRIR